MEAHGEVGGSSNGNGKDVAGGSGMTAGHEASQSAPTPGPGYIFTGSITNPWSHAAHYGRQGFSCHYCGLKRQGGGSTRLKEHLGGLGGSVVECYNVPSEVQAAMRKNRLVYKQKKSKVQARKLRLELELLEEMGGSPLIDLDPASDEEDRVRLEREKALRGIKLRNAVDSMGSMGSRFEVGSGSGSVNVESSPTTPANGKITQYLQRKSSLSPADGGNRTPASGRQPRIDFSNQKLNAAKLGQAWAKWFHANDIPGRKINCPLFRAALKLTQELHAVKHLPTAYEVDGIYLDANYMEMRAFVENMKQDWDRFGVTVMCDSWTGPTGMSIINFMIYCNGVMFFHKTVNATGRIQNSEFILKEIKKVVIDEIGQKVVVQIVTDNGSNYKKACKDLVKEYPQIYWQPCAAHTVNLMLKTLVNFMRLLELSKVQKGLVGSSTITTGCMLR